MFPLRILSFLDERCTNKLTFTGPKSKAIIFFSTESPRRYLFFFWSSTLSLFFFLHLPLRWKPTNTCTTSHSFTSACWPIHPQSTCSFWVVLKAPCCVRSGRAFDCAMCVNYLHYPPSLSPPLPLPNSFSGRLLRLGAQCHDG